VDQDQQGLPARIQLAPARADLRAVTADHPGHIGQGLGRQRQRSTVEKHGSPCVDDEDLAIASSTRGFVTLRAATPTVINPCSSRQDQDEKGSMSVTSEDADQQRIRRRARSAWDQGSERI
jgi:hypothetical protein